jgi:DNA processing protein
LLPGARRPQAEHGKRMNDRIVTPEDDEWPRGFADLPDPPVFLSVRGRLPAGGVAIVGARDADDDACAFARALAARLGRAVISGLARGIDAAAHRGALDAGLPTVAYVGTGLARTFPPEHAELAETIVARGGALASEFPEEQEASEWSLMRRDRLQAAHGDAVVLVVSDLAGGAMHTLRFARELGRPRFVLDDGASGNHAALADGALLLPRDVEAAASRILAVP